MLSNGRVSVASDAATLEDFDQLLSRSIMVHSELDMDRIQPCTGDDWITIFTKLYWFDWIPLCNCDALFFSCDL